ncbi:GntR family transcriptional regulator [Cryobacterium sp. PH29-G1]|uniref:GntR family transcriptional regulator n=1 Tax=Cryobacterium sp. PH29-G1 TaxID=3046211 RepID=UPI0024B9FB9F|nr:GntR family transcriptional regulator [Cryobacterium sp. PH29-G1]MDJ0348854.1 GntR family transcriptional regulator [Cryobacterium sp. PH29-G1]
MKMHSSVLQPLDSRALSLTERTINALREAIRNGSLTPGALYSVYQIAEDLGVSRSPVREALLRLAETGIVRFERNKGFRVVVPGPSALAEMIAVRIALEVPAARHAANAAKAGDDHGLLAECKAMQAAATAQDVLLFMTHDQRLHGIILELAGNSYVQRIIENLRDASRLVGPSTIKGTRTLSEVFEEHLPIVNAIIAGDGPGAARAMHEHLKTTGRILLHDAVSRPDAGEHTDDAELWTRFID